MKPFLFVFLILPFLLVAMAQSDFDNIERKIKMIRAEQVHPGTVVDISPREVAAYVEGHRDDLNKNGVHDARVELITGGAQGSASIDFAKLRGPEEGRMDFLLNRLLAGERPVKVTAKVRSARPGFMIVDLEKVAISGVEIRGATLDFLIEQVLKPNLPDAKIGEPIELSDGVDRLEFLRQGIKVHIKG